MSPAAPGLPPLLRLADLCQRFQVSRITIWEWRRKRGFPQPIRFSPGCVRWREADVAKWEKARAAA